MRELTCYEYVPIPYDRVRAALVRDAARIFQGATLHAQLGAIEVGADVEIEVVGRRDAILPGGVKTTEVELRWQGARAPGLFPVMEAKLTIYPLSAGETQLDLHGRYRPPFGVVGVALDAAAGHKIAEASVLRFVKDVAAQLTKELGALQAAIAQPSAASPKP